MFQISLISNIETNVGKYSMGSPDLGFSYLDTPRNFCSPLYLNVLNVCTSIMVAGSIGSLTVLRRLWIGG